MEITSIRFDACAGEHHLDAWTSCRYNSPLTVIFSSVRLILVSICVLGIHSKTVACACPCSGSGTVE